MYVYDARKFESNILFHRYLDRIEHAVSNGDCVLIENIGESLDPVLDPIIGRNTIKKGRYKILFESCSASM